jgi:hypothetical protein
MYENLKYYFVVVAVDVLLGKSQRLEPPCCYLHSPNKCLHILANLVRKPPAVVVVVILEAVGAAFEGYGSGGSALG